MKEFQGKVAVITGAASGIGRELAVAAATRGMKLVLADINQDALANVAQDLRTTGASVITRHCDVRHAVQVQSLADAAMTDFGKVHLLFNNAGVSCGGLVWENSVTDWEWVLGVNLWSVIHGVRIFTPLMLELARDDPAYRGHVVNTASMAGLLNAPAMGIYNVSKHAVISLSESLYHDLALVGAPVGVSVLCPYFIPTAISQSERVRPQDVPVEGPVTASQAAAQAMLDKAVMSGKVSAAQMADITFNAIRNNQFYVYSHPHALSNVQGRMNDILAQRNPRDPYEVVPQVRQALQAAIQSRRV